MRVKNLPLAGLLTILAAPAPVSGGTVELRATEIVAVTDSRGEGTDFTLLRFDLPPEVADGRITHATLFVGFACGEDSLVSAIAHPVSVDWQRGSITSSAVSAEGFYDARAIAQLHAVECAEGGGTLDVTQWVRAWGTGERPNYGLVVRPTTTGEGKLRVVAAQESLAPGLRITFRPRRSPEDQEAAESDR